MNRAEKDRDKMLRITKIMENEIELKKINQKNRSTS